jgi:uncharacterized membrane protein (DUF485 family)
VAAAGEDSEVTYNDLYEQSNSNTMTEKYVVIAVYLQLLLEVCHLPLQAVPVFGQVIDIIIRLLQLSLQQLQQQW